MANREQLAIIKQARSGQVEAQLMLGKLYLRGSSGLPQSSSTALYWLDRAAQQGCTEAWLEIGSHVPFEVAQQSERGPSLCDWYWLAFEAGVMEAGLIYARLVLSETNASEARQLAANRALHAAAEAGVAQAQWLLAQQASASADAQHPTLANSVLDPQHWVASAAQGGVTEAQQALAESAWQAGRWDVFLRWALPLAQNLAQQAHAWHATHSEPGQIHHPFFAQEQVSLLARCAHAIWQSEQPKVDEMQRFCELAALHGERGAQLQLGLWFARMDQHCNRIHPGFGSANFKKATRWLTLAGEQGVASAWFALSRIFLKPEFSQRSVPDAQSYLERAADLGHIQAQAECGAHAWRNRREQDGNDVRALYWLQKAAAQGESQAQAMLEKIAPKRVTSAWAQQAQRLLTREIINGQPFLAARIELAALFDLTRAEALLIDINQFDHGHCLQIDIRAQYGRSKRQLLLVRTAQQRQALDRIARLFEDVDCGPNGPEGNYRQRLYRLKTCLPHLMDDVASAEE
ncbi:MAG: SEL1-like repeat protein [Burkholderiales bacterium]|nr:SEL1-like repeat protein [Burkholderiales bacterium]